MPGLASTDQDGFELTDEDGFVIDESCASTCAVCGPCSTFIRLLPCTPAIDCITGAPNPGPGVWICSTAQCSDGRAPGDIPRPTVLLDTNGDDQFECFSWDGQPAVSTPPPDAVIIPTPASGSFECGPPCGEGPCIIARTGWAKAVKCSPLAPDLYFCRGDFPFCVTTAITPIWLVGAGPQNPGCAYAPFAGHCYRFLPYAPVLAALPPGACVARPPQGFNFALARNATCCSCQTGCAHTGRTIPRTCPDLPPPAFTLDCCCGNLSAARVEYGGRNVIDSYTMGFGGPYRNAHIDQQWSGNSTITGLWRETTQFYNEDGSTAGPPQVNTQPIPPFGATCELRTFPRYDFIQCQSPCPSGGGWTAPVETRTCTTWSIRGSYDCGANPSQFPGARVISSGWARLVGMADQPGCSNARCVNARPGGGGRRPPGTVEPEPVGGGMLAEGTDNGGVTIRGGGSRAMAEVEEEGAAGGCGGCSDGMGF